MLIVFAAALPACSGSGTNPDLCTPSALHGSPGAGMHGTIIVN